MFIVKGRYLMKMVKTDDGTTFEKHILVKPLIANTLMIEYLRLK
jgi:hypothetical protein